MRPLLLLLCGCGRLGFGPVDVDARPGDGAAGDGVSDPGMTGDGGPEVVETFGERTGTTHSGVTRDTTLSFANGSTFNFGGADNLRVELDNFDTALLAFDVTQLPTSAKIASAEIDVVAELGVVGATITVRTLIEPWTEGTLDGAAGVASYSERMTGTAWTTPGALPPGSASNDVVATFTPATVGSHTFSIPAAVVQAWLDTPASNHGLVMSSSSNNTVRFASSEGPAADRPRLLVRYLP